MDRILDVTYEYHLLSEYDGERAENRTRTRTRTRTE